MHSARGRFALISNGEIYNFRALRRELEGAGSVFLADAIAAKVQDAVSPVPKRKREHAIEHFNGGLEPHCAIAASMTSVSQWLRNTDPAPSSSRRKARKL